MLLKLNLQIENITKATRINNVILWKKYTAVQKFAMVRFLFLKEVFYVQGI